MAKGRDNKGRFIKGNRIGIHDKRGRPTDAVRLELHAIIDKNVSQKSINEAWKRLSSVLEAGGKGWLEYFKFYLDRRYGRPEQFISADVTSGGESLVPPQHFEIALKRAYLPKETGDDSTGQVSGDGSESELPARPDQELSTG